MLTSNLVAIFLEPTFDLYFANTEVFKITVIAIVTQNSLNDDTVNDKIIK